MKGIRVRFPNTQHFDSVVFSDHEYSYIWVGDDAVKVDDYVLVEAAAEIRIAKVSAVFSVPDQNATKIGFQIVDDNAWIEGRTALEARKVLIAELKERLKADQLTQAFRDLAARDPRSAEILGQLGDSIPLSLL